MSEEIHTVTREEYQRDPQKVVSIALEFGRVEITADDRVVAAISAPRDKLSVDWGEMAPETQKAWKEFRESGLLWVVNRTLHIFGWAIVFRIDGDTDAIMSVTPERVAYRGFPRAAEESGYRRITAWLRDNAETLNKEVGE